MLRNAPRRVCRRDAAYVNLDRVKLSIERYSGNAAFYNVAAPLTCSDITVQPFDKGLFSADQRKTMGRAAIEVQCIYEFIEYMLLMHYPAENNILKFRAGEESVKQMGDVAIYHRYRFAGHDKWLHIPAPIAIKEYVSWEYFL